jgi:2-keto-4-pentenoate hydratase
MRALLARRSAALAAGESPVGWKIGINVAALQAHFGLSGPVVGYLTDATVIAPGTPVAISAWTRPALEVEVAVRVGPDGGVAGLAPALELVDLDLGFDDIEPILAGNIFHRGVVFDLEVERVDLHALDVEVRRDGEVVATGSLLEPPRVTVEVVRAFLSAHGAVLSPGDRIIAGSMITPLSVAPGEQLDVGFGELGSLAVSFT